MSQFQALSGQQGDVPASALSLMELGKQLRETPLGAMDLSQIKQSELTNLQRLLMPKMTKYIPHVPTPKQAAFLLLDNKEAFYGGAAGGGKLLNVDTPIFTDSGWKTVGTLTKADRIVALDGTWTDIEYITSLQHCPINYKVILSCGTEIECNAEHLWTVDKIYIKSHQRRKRTYYERLTLTTQEILDRGVLTKKNNKMQAQWRLPKHPGVQGNIQQLPIDPWLLGYWLGDGSSSQGRITVGYEDNDSFERECFARGIVIQNIRPSEHGNCADYTIEGLRALLCKNNLINSKHIPSIYMLASREQRIELLKGLMDSDGHSQARGRCEWAQAIERKELFDQVCELISSLGYKISVSRAPTKLKGKSFPSYRVTFTPYEEIFTLDRKNSNLLLDFPIEKQLSNGSYYIEDIVQIEPNIPMKCIRIKHPSHVFLVGKQFIPTHNSDALLMGGLQYVDVKGYAGIIFRKTYADLTKPGALIDRAKEWLFPFIAAGEVRWNDKDKKFEFFERHGRHKEAISTLQFGYLESANDKYNYQGGEYQYIGFDELTHIDVASYTYMFSRLRRLRGVEIPLRVRSASNPPDDDSGLWVKERFIDDGPAKGRIFIPAGLDDNPYLDKEEYEESLEELDPVTRARLRDGNWEIVRRGNMFKRDWFQPVDKLPPYRKRIRFWDMAATDEEKAKKRNRSQQPDYTVGFLMSRWQNTYYIEDIVRVRKRPADTEQLQLDTAIADGHSTIIREEREPGSSGISVIDIKKRNLLNGFDYDENHSTGTKTARANPFSAAAERGQVKYLIGCRNIEAFFNEAESFPGGIHDDMVDGGSGAFNLLDSLITPGMPLAVLKDEEQVSTWAHEQELTAGYFTQDFNRLY